MTAAQADAALMRLARDVLADLVATQQVLALSQVRGFERVVGGKVEEVRPFERLEGEAVHEHLGTPDMRPDSLYDLSDYKNEGYRWVNPVLRSASYEEAASKIHGLPQKATVDRTVGHLDDAFDRQTPTTKPLLVYRGARGFGSGRMTPGTILHDDAYMSTTTDKDTAAAFASGGGANPKYAQIVRITVPPGEKALSLARLIEEGQIHNWDPQSADADEEKEVLLGRGRDMRVTGTHGRFLDVELLPKKAQAAPASAAPAKPSAADLLAKAAAYKKAQQVAASSPLSKVLALAAAASHDRSKRFVWEPGDLRITRPPAPIA